MKTYPSYDALAVDLDLHFFDKVSILKNVGNRCDDGSWFVTTNNGQCYLFDKDGNLDDINKITILQAYFIRRDIKKIIIPNSITAIGYGTFMYCSSLVNITIPNSVKSIGGFAFNGCSDLTDILILDSVKSIGNWAFKDCNRLTSLFFKGKTLKQVKVMKSYPWGIKDENIIKAEL